MEREPLSQNLPFERLIEDPNVEASKDRELQENSERKELNKEANDQQEEVVLTKEDNHEVNTNLMNLTSSFSSDISLQKEKHTNIWEPIV